MPDLQDCIFCKIANKQIETEFVFESENTVVIKDLHPQAPVHLLVIPKAHYKSLNELDDESLMSEMLMTIKNVTKKLGITDYKTLINTGELAGQVIGHVHFHILSGKNLCNL